MDPRDITAVGLVGAGLMGQGIAALLAARGCRVTIADVSAEIAHHARARILAQIPQHANAAEPETSPAELAGRVRVAESERDLAGVELLIEAVAEHLRTKTRVLGRIVPLLRPDAVVATNTSSLSVGAIAGGLLGPHRVCGLHFCHPVAERSLVEIVRAPRTDGGTIDRVARLAARLGQRVVVVPDRPGFLVNRLLWPYLNEALELLHEGVPAATIEQAALEFGMPWGPLRQLDAIGIDVALRVGAGLRRAYPDRVGKSGLLVALFEAHRLGDKCGAGILCDDCCGDGDAHSGARGDAANEARGDAANEVRGDAANDARGVVLPPAVRERVARGACACKAPDRTDVPWRLLLPMLLEAVRVLEEQVVTDPAEIDAAVVHGLNFFTAQGGILRWADALGLESIAARLKRFERCGERYAPPRTLRAMIRAGLRFYAERTRFAA